ncbi:MAG: hypothetical protein CM1200mP9_06610 [Gammaproteobacteria bacterium]|nr:MAG: hypothetical protein CM1200mP9_06610 [Gammaproteobacteria bacterium]
MKHKLGIFLMLLFAGLANAADETPRKRILAIAYPTRFSFDAFLLVPKPRRRRYAFARGEPSPPGVLRFSWTPRLGF